jgi:cob(I)alamin adenosyltransferase
LNELDEYIASKGLFLPAAMKQQFREIIPIIQRSLISVETSLELDEYKMRREAGTDLSTAEPLIESIEKKIGERLQSHARK